MINYIKFAFYQIFTFTKSIKKLKTINLDNPTDDDVFYAHKFLQTHAYKSLKLVNINLHIKGKEKIPNEPVLFVVNHACMLDSFIVLSSIETKTGYVIADEPTWTNIPVFPKWAKLIKSVYINRQSAKEGMKAINEASENIKNNHSMVVFPEGELTWIKDPNAKISDFRTGALKIAYKANCKIVPIVIKNSKDMYVGNQPIGKINSKDVYIEFLAPIDNHIKNPKLKTVELGEMIRDKMLEKMM